MTIDTKLIDQLLKDYKSPEDVLGENGILKQFTKAILERAMQAEMTTHLGYEPHAPEGKNSGNSRNGTSAKTLKGDFGELPIETPRDRDGSFSPKIIPKGKTRLDGFDDKIISLYARGLSTREIQQHLEDIYKVEVSPALISNVTEAVVDEVTAWQNRPLEAVYPVVYMDALQVKIRDGAHVTSKAVHLAIGVGMAGTKEVLGMWLAQTEGARVLIADRHGAEEPRSTGHLHRVRRWTQRLPRSDRVSVSTDADTTLHRAYGSPLVERASATSSAKKSPPTCSASIVRRRARKPNANSICSAGRGTRSTRRSRARGAPTGSGSCRSSLTRRKSAASSTETNTVESLNMSLRKIIKTRGSFPTDEAALKLIYLALRNITRRWTMPVANWRAALNRFAILFEGRLPSF